MPAPITLDLALSRPSAVAPSDNVLHVAAMFGLGIDADRLLAVIPPVRLTLAPGRVVFVTGPSGSGKSSLLALIAAALRDRRDASVIDLADPPTDPGHAGSTPGDYLQDRPLVDGFPHLPLDRALALLSAAGLNDAFVMLRRPRELSDGQRYRLRLAHAMSRADAPGNGACDALGDAPLTVVLADEFAATLDRLTAAVIARNVRKWTTRHRGLCFVAATTHDDLLEPLDPDVLVEKHLGAGIQVLIR